jgi:hypothetical protein
MGSNESKKYLENKICIAGMTNTSNLHPYNDFPLLHECNPDFRGDSKELK